MYDGTAWWTNKVTSDVHEDTSELLQDTVFEEIFFIVGQPNSSTRMHYEICGLENMTSCMYNT